MLSASLHMAAKCAVRTQAAAEEQERLKAIAEKKAEKAAEAKKKEMLAKIPAPDQMKLDATPYAHSATTQSICARSTHQRTAQVRNLAAFAAG